MEPEQYIISQNPEVQITQGKFFNLIHGKHVASYSQHGADNIVKNVRATFAKLMYQLSTDDNHNSLLVGKVQSGKTSNLELLTALAFDNGYNLLVIFGGYDTELLKQCNERFSSSFGIAHNNTEIYDVDSPVLFTTNDSDNEYLSIKSLNSDLALDFINDKRPIILTCLKRPDAIKKTNRLLRDLMNANVFMPFVIDDEGDQASLNTAKDKNKEATPTYHRIQEMKHILMNPLYLSVTATPQANIFQADISDLMPSSIHLIHPGCGYNGANVYHLAENEIMVPVNDDDDSLKISDSQRSAIYYFLIASAIKELRGNSSKDRLTDMIIHVDRTIAYHSSVYSCIHDMISQIKDSFDNRISEPSNFEYYCQKLHLCYMKYLSEELRKSYPFNEDFIVCIGNAIRRTGVILQNSAGKNTKEMEKIKWHKIYVGGDLLQRGLTFGNLVVSYFTRSAKQGNMDTTLQRARWFGYRNNYLDLCKIFTTDKLSAEFAYLAEAEDDLWEQFSDVENGLLRINDILIPTDENIKLKPTAKNKAKYKRVSFKNRWINQRYLVLDDNKLSNNNNNIENLIKSIANWTKTDVGSTDAHETGQFAYVNFEQLRTLINSIDTAFDKEPFRKRPLIDLVDSDNIPVILMWTEDNDLRYRSVYTNTTDRIKALQQGADNSDETKQKYKGDKKVIINPEKVNIQIHHISPGFSKSNKLGKDQYMFSIYVPKDKYYYVKNYENK